MLRPERALAWLLVLFAPVVQAELSVVGAGGFTTTHQVETPVTADAAWAVMTDSVSEWWNGDHSWSGEAANLYVDTSPGGCFCERLADGGWVQHLGLVYLAPGKELRFRGALGPLMTLGLTGTMTWAIEPAEAGSRITFTYVVSGFQPNGFDALAPAVDGVIAEQLTRLASRLAD